MKMVNWNDTSKEEIMILREISLRAVRLFPNANLLNVEMDVNAAHLSCPLKLKEMLASDDADFMHDIGGISRHINRETGELENCFVPRFAA